MPASTLLFGGTFDPIHLGHLQVAERVQAQFHFDRFLFVPCRVPVHKASTHTPAHHRLAMITRALCEYPVENAALCLEEIHRQSPSYTLNTLQRFRRKLGPHSRLSFLLGLDAFLTLHEWNHPEKFFTYADFIVLFRPGQGVHPPATSQHVQFFDAGAFEISSTSIRQHVREGLCFEQFVPSRVAAYIRQHRLYRSASSAICLR